MKIVVVGCGKIGAAIVEGLSAEGYDVVAVDDDDAVLAQISNIYDVMCLCGNGADCDTLAEAGVKNAELVVATTGSDELNMLICFLARSMGALHTIARIRKPEYNDRNLTFMKQQLNLSLALNPERLAAREMCNILRFPSAVNVETFSARNFEMVELRLKQDTVLDGMTLAEVRRKYEGNYLICAVQRADKAYIPDGSFVLRGGDRIGLTAAPNEAAKLLKKLGLLQKQARSVMILGGSKTAVYLARLLIAGGCDAKIVEMDAERCTHISSAVPEATVINGDGASQELLLEEGLASMDAFVALTGMDEENILISCFASQQNVPKVITKVNRPEFAAMAERLGLECIISPKKITVNVATLYARAISNSEGSSIETLYRLMDGEIEALEFSVQPGFTGMGVPLKDLKLRPGVLIAGIIRGRKPIIPGGGDCIQEGDKVVVIAAKQHLGALEDILKTRLIEE